MCFVVSYCVSVLMYQCFCFIFLSKLLVQTFETHWEGKLGEVVRFVPVVSETWRCHRIWILSKFGPKTLDWERVLYDNCLAHYINVLFKNVFTKKMTKIKLLLMKQRSVCRVTSTFILCPVQACSSTIRLAGAKWTWSSFLFIATRLYFNSSWLGF